MVNDTLRCAAFTVEGASPLGAVAVGWAIVLDLYIFVDNLVVVPFLEGGSFSDVLTSGQQSVKHVST